MVLVFSLPLTHFQLPCHFCFICPSLFGLTCFSSAFKNVYFRHIIYFQLGMEPFPPKSNGTVLGLTIPFYPVFVVVVYSNLILLWEKHK